MRKSPDEFIDINLLIESAEEGREEHRREASLVPTLRHPDHTHDDRQEIEKQNFC